MARGIVNRPGICACGSDQAFPKTGKCPECTMQRFRRNNYTPAMRQELRDTYAADLTRDGLRDALRNMAEKFGVTPSSIRYEAQKMGISHARRTWTKAEDDYIRAHAGLCGANAIGKHLGRTHAAVRTRANVIKVHLKVWAGFKRSEVSRLLHASPETVERWRSLGWLVPDATGMYTHPGIERFLRRHLDVLDLRRIDQNWLKETLRNMLGSDDDVSDEVVHDGNMAREAMNQAPGRSLAY